MIYTIMYHMPFYMLQVYLSFNAFCHFINRHLVIANFVMCCVQAFTCRKLHHCVSFMFSFLRLIKILDTRVSFQNFEVGCQEGQSLLWWEVHLFCDP